MTSRLALAGDAGHDRGRAYADEEAADRLIRRRLDARGTTVRMGMRLIAGLRSAGVPAAEDALGDGHRADDREQPQEHRR